MNFGPILTAEERDFLLQDLGYVRVGPEHSENLGRVTSEELEIMLKKWGAIIMQRQLRGTA